MGQANAAEIAVSGNTDWINSNFNGDPPVEVSNSFRISGIATVDVTDYQAQIDRFSVYLNGVLIGTTSIITNTGVYRGTPEEGFTTAGFSSGTFNVTSGLLTIFTKAEAGASNGGYMAVRFRNYSPPPSNALRQDTAGTITEKSNVVTCTPGAYTFLNGGSTAEVANIQSYVYTLLVNGTAVSTLSSDGFKSVASHLFPTIEGLLLV